MRRAVIGSFGALAVIAGSASLLLALPLPRADAAPPAPGSACGSSAPSLDPGTPDEQTLVDYFEALDARDYPTAWNFLGGDVQSLFGSPQGYAELMAQHVGCVRLLGVKPYGAHTYLVSLADQYLMPFPAGSGELPAFWTVDEGTIVEFGTGPP